MVNRLPTSISRMNPGRRAAANLLTRDGAADVANVAQLLELLKRPQY